MDWDLELGRLTPVSDTTVRSAFSESEPPSPPRRKPGRPRGSTSKKLKALEALFDDPNIISGRRAGSSKVSPVLGSVPIVVAEFHRACQYGQVGLVESMLRKDKVDVNCRDSSLNTPLHEAVRYSQTEVVRILLKFGAEFEAENIIGEKPADITNSHEIAELLADFAEYSKEEHVFLRICWLGQLVRLHRQWIANSEDLNFNDQRGASGLHYAAVRDHAHLAGILISEGVDINAKNIKGNTALHEACRFSSAEILRILLEAGAVYSMLNNAGHSPIFYASKQLRRVFRKFARDKGIDDSDLIMAATTQRYMEDDDEDDETEESGGILTSHRMGGLTREERKLQQMLAIFSRSASASDVDGTKKRRGRPPLQTNGIVTEEELTPPPRKMHSPARLRSTSNTVRSKLDPSYVDKSTGRTQLHKYAARGKLTDILELLRLDQSLLGRRDNAGYLALHEACLSGQLAVVRALVEAGSDVNATSDNGDTALHDAAENMHVEIVKYLLSEGADAAVKNLKGKTPADVSKDDKIIGILRASPQKDTSIGSEFEEVSQLGTPRRSSRRVGNTVEAGLDKLFAKTNGRKVVEIITNEPLVQLHCGATENDKNSGWYYLAAQADTLFQKSFHPHKLLDNIPLSKRRHLTPEEIERLLESAIVDRLGNFRKYLLADPILLNKDTVQRAFDRAGGSLANVPVLYADLQRLVRRPDEHTETVHMPPKLKMKWQRKSAENPA